VVPEIAVFAERISNCNVTEAIVRGGELYFISRISPTMRMCGRWHLQGHCKSNCWRSVDHGAHHPVETAALVAWCQVAYACRMGKRVPPSQGAQLMPPTTMPIISPVPSAPVVPPTLRTHHAPTNHSVSSSLPPTIQSVRPHERLSDKLGIIIDVAVDSFNQSSSWEEFVSKSRHTCDIAPGVQHIDHPAATILHQYKKRGVPVIMNTAQWPAAKIDSTIKRRPHKSALKELLFLRQEFAAMMRKGQWTVLPASLAQKTQRDKDKPRWHCATARSSPSHDCGLFVL
jgi:hypothetical protein